MKNITIIVLVLLVASCNQQSKERKIIETDSSETATESDVMIRTIDTKNLKAILDTVYEEDQKLRRQLKDVEEKFGKESIEMQEHWQSIHYKDSINLIKIQKILDEHGWLGQDAIGGIGNTTLFLVIQHAPLKVQQKYLPMMQEAVIKGNARGADLALLEDRVSIRSGKRQIYGSQIGRNQETGEFYVVPIEDPENVDKRRSEVGLGSLADYVEGYDIVWDIERHKKMTAELEAVNKS